VRVEKKVESEPQLEANLNEMMQVRTGGDPDKPEMIFTNLSPTEMADKATELGTPVSDKTVAAWLDEASIGYRKMVKNIPCGHSDDRGQQFNLIAEHIQKYRDLGNPVFSVDTKSKEFLGKLYRAGRIRTSEPVRAFDHDFPSLATGVVIPHGIFDMARNVGHINLGLSHETSKFAADSLRWYWNRIGKQCYPAATSILLLCDCGGSNSASKYIFKHYLQRLVDSIGVEIRVAHFPSYCSKYNPIERRFFPHIGRACSGMLFDTLETVVDLMRQAKTRTGLRTTVNVLRGIYHTGENATQEMKLALRTVYDKLIPKWNYRFKPIGRH
jgi:hypothetical protein